MRDDKRKTTTGQTLRGCGSTFAIIAVTAVVVFALAFGGHALGLFNLKFWGTKYADAKREIFEESQSYRHGMVRDFRNLRMEYEKAPKGSSQRQVIRSTVLHRAGAVELEEFPQDVQLFIKQLETQ